MIVFVYDMDERITWSETGAIISKTLAYRNNSHNYNSSTHPFLFGDCQMPQLKSVMGDPLPAGLTAFAVEQSLSTRSCLNSFTHSVAGIQINGQIKSMTTVVCNSWSQVGALPSPTTHSFLWIPPDCILPPPAFHTWWRRFLWSLISDPPVHGRRETFTRRHLSPLIANVAAEKSSSCLH